MSSVPPSRPVTPYEKFTDVGSTAEEKQHVLTRVVWQPTALRKGTP